MGFKTVQPFRIPCMYDKSPLDTPGGFGLYCLPPQRQLLSLSTIVHIMAPTHTSEALGHFRGVDLTSRPNQLCARIFADFGAEVIKVEPPGGDPGRYQGAFFGNESGANRSLRFTYLNRAKLSCTIDTRKAEGKALIKRMLDQSGIVVENFRPGVMDRLNLSYDDLHAVRSDLIMLSMPGFGNAGPLREYYSYGQQVMGMTGLSHLWGHPC